jgi:hypothetical protein
MAIIVANEHVASVCPGVDAWIGTKQVSVDVAFGGAGLLARGPAMMHVRRPRQK